MSVELLIYLAESSDRVLPILYLVCSTAVAVSGGGVLVAFSESKEIKPILFKILISSTLALLCVGLIPSSKTLYMMAGVSYNKEAVQSETALKIKKLIDGKLDEALAELEKK